MRRLLTLLFLTALALTLGQTVLGEGASDARKEQIAAINKDSEAAIFQHARFGVVGDALELLPELIRAARS